MDWMEQEKSEALPSCQLPPPLLTAALDKALNKNKTRINIIDTPGHVDFTAEVERSLRVLDGGVVILDAGSGVQSQTETVWRQADKYHVPRVAFVNKMDVLGADFHATIKDFHEKLGSKTAIMALPIGTENQFKGVILLLERQSLIWESDETGASYTVSDNIPEDMKAEVEAHRAALIEQICELNDSLLEQYLEGKEPSIEDLKKALRQATIANQIVPVYPGSSLRNKGVQPLLDAVVDFLPSPFDVPP